MIRVDLRLRVPFAVMDVVDVVTVLHGVVAVARQVLVIARFGVLGRGYVGTSFLAMWTTRP